MSQRASHIPIELHLNQLQTLREDKVLELSYGSDLELQGGVLAFGLGPGGVGLVYGVPEGGLGRGVAGLQGGLAGTREPLHPWMRYLERRAELTQPRATSMAHTRPSNDASRS